MGTFVVYDWDNTLGCCTELYDDARSRFAALALRLFPGVGSREAVLAAFQLIDKSNVARLGFGLERFPTSMADTLRHFAEEHGVACDAAWENEARTIGRSIFDASLYRPFDGVAEMLEAQRRAGLRLGVCTKGDDRFQRSKVEQSGLGKFFDAVMTVNPAKTAADVLGVANQLRALGADGPGFMVGDSLTDDIASGLEAGLTTVWISGGVRPSWERDDVEGSVRPHHSIDHVTGMQRILGL